MLCGSLNAYFYSIILDVALIFLPSCLSSDILMLFQISALQSLYKCCAQKHSLPGNPAAHDHHVPYIHICTLKLWIILLIATCVYVFRSVHDHCFFFIRESMCVLYIMLHSASIMDTVQGATLHKAALGPKCSKCRRLVKGHPHPHGSPVHISSQRNSHSNHHCRLDRLPAHCTSC